MVAPTVRRAGAAKNAPFTILLVANPAIETPFGSGTFVPDPILKNQAGFDAAVTYIDDSLFGKLPGQADLLLGDPAIAPEVRLLTLFDTTLAANAANSFVGQHITSELLIARRAAIKAFLTRQNLIADVVYAVTDSKTHTRASAWFTSDDDAQTGVPFVVDTNTFHHRHWYTVPGTVAIHRTASSLTAPHEFGHAISSYSNGMVVDLYVDSPAALNCRVGPPINKTFATYQGTAMPSDTARKPIGYPPGWKSYHCGLSATAAPALMDNYWLGTPPEGCENDLITRQFLRDRVLAKMGR